MYVLYKLCMYNTVFSPVLIVLSPECVQPQTPPRPHPPTKCASLWREHYINTINAVSCHCVHNTLLLSLAAESLSSDEEFPFSDEEEGGMDVAVDHYHYETLVSYIHDCVYSVLSIYTAVCPGCRYLYLYNIYSISHD